MATPNTSLFGVPLWGGLTTPLGNGTPLDVANSVADAVFRLGFQSQIDVQGPTSWVTLDELYQWADEAAKKLAYESGLFITYDSSIAGMAGTAIYNLPAAHVFSLVVWYGSSLLRLTNVGELWALDANWGTTSGVPARASMDAGAVGIITLYPNPNANGTLSQVCEEYPATVASGASQLALPNVLQDYFTYAMLKAARGKESPGRMGEMADHYAQRCALYEQLIDHLWGPGA